MSTRHLHSLVFAFVSAAAAILPVRASAATLVWSDEFNQAENTAPDPVKWSYDLGGGGWGNNELESYTNDRANSYITADAAANDGKALAIVARKESNGSYTSARLKTQGKFTTTYGRIEARIRVANGQGIWPAFWMLGQNITTVSWPTCGEIDVMEVIGKNPITAYGTMHGPGYSGDKGIGGHYTLSGGATLDQAFHIYAVDWSPGKVVWSADGTVYHTVNRTDIPSGTSWVFDDAPFFLILNLAVGGNWPGNPDGTTPFPQTLTVDYVRVYALDVPVAAPAVPAGAGAYASGANEVTVTWLPPAAGAAPTGYRLERATDEAFTTQLTTFALATTATSYVDTSAMANTRYYYRLFATNAGGASPATATMEVLTPTITAAGTAAFVNISSRAYCSTGNNVTIGGFVISGSSPKRVLVRAVGPTLTSLGIGDAEVLRDPTIELHDASHGNVVLAANDNWADDEDAAELPVVVTQVGANPLAATDTKSSALLRTLNPGVYTFLALGAQGTSGIVLVEVYDADAPGGRSSFVNISTRAYATTGNGVTIGGFVISGTGSKRVLLRAVGPTLTTQQLAEGEVLTDPMIELHAGRPVIATNDDWSSNANAASIVSTGSRIGALPFDASDNKSSALLLTLPAGVYSFIAQGKTSTSGIVLVEVYDAD